MIILANLNSEAIRVDMAMKFVAQCNPFAQQKAGGQKPSPSVPRVIGQMMSCVICVTRGKCLGKSCLGDNGKLLFHQLKLSDYINILVLPKVTSHSNLTLYTAAMMGGKIPGCQANSLYERRNRTKMTRTDRFVF